MGAAVGDPPRPAGRLSREEAEIVRQARDDVRLHGVVRAQGYFLGRPGPLAAAASLCRRPTSSEPLEPELP